MMYRRLVAGSLSLLCLLTYPAAAMAEPQILAAMPTGKPVELVCRDGICSAEFSTICLQPARSVPPVGTPYLIHPKHAALVTLRGHAAAGEQIVPLSVDLIKAKSNRGQTSVTFYASRAALERKGLQSASINFGRMIALVPVATRSASVAQANRETTTVAAQLRRIEEAWAMANADNLAIARVTSRMRNALIGNISPIPRATHRLLQRALENETSISSQSLKSARGLVAVCQRRARISKFSQCLADYHDQIMLGVNGKYWTILRSGS
jgi:hypothetical protein